VGAPGRVPGRLTPAQHQLLLAIRGHADPGGPTIAEVAAYMLLRHHSAVGLVDRAEANGLVRRIRHRSNYRAVRLRLTGEGRQRLESLASMAVGELRRLAPALRHLLEGLDLADLHLRA
jgi:DNA-binding MarR family transcriptional regulator